MLHYLNKQDLDEWNLNLFHWKRDIHVFSWKSVQKSRGNWPFLVLKREFLASKGTVSSFTHPDLVYLGNIIYYTAKIASLAKIQQKNIFSSIFFNFHHFSSFFVIFRHFSSFFVIFRHFSSFFVIFHRFSSVSSILFTFNAFWTKIGQKRG